MRLNTFKKNFYRWERLLVTLLRGRVFFALGKFIRGRGTLTTVIVIALFVAVSNIFAKTNEDVFLKGYWHESRVGALEKDRVQQDAHEEGLALGSDAPAQSSEQIAAAVDSETHKKVQETDLSTLSRNDDKLLAEEVVDESTLTGTDVYDNSERPETTIYTVQEGDTVAAIAHAHGVTVDTLLWANELDDPDEISPGDTIIILSVSGLQHKIASGDTIESIAKKYKAGKDEIIAFNSLPANGELVVGETLTIPGGIKEKPPEPVKTTVVARRTYTSAAPSSATTVRSGYYARPISGGRRTQGIHRTNAVDLAAPSGTPIYAAAPGKVVIARYGWNGGYGNYVVIQHSNGTQTLYAHMIAGGIVTKAGKSVKRGQLIGHVGSTGRSSGPHVHFEVHGARNPF